MQEATHATSSDTQEQASVTATAEANAEIVFNDVFDNVIGVNNDVGLEGVGIFGRVASCYTISVTQTLQGQVFPFRISIDFGTGCTGKDGRTRFGKIITEYTGRLIIPGKSSTTRFENYKMDSWSIDGTYKITNTGSLAQRQFTVEVNGAKFSWKQSKYFGWNSHRVITQTQGFRTLSFEDDVFSISGNTFGELTTETFATAWQSEIIQPLQKKFICPWINQGIVEVTRQNLPFGFKWVGILSYGNGECDDNALLTVNEIVHQITLY